MGLRTVLLWAAILAIGGCTGAIEGGKTSTMNPALCPEARQSLEAAGGFKAWQGVSVVRAKAVVTIREPDGQSYVNTVDLRIDLPGGTLEASGQTGTGAWQGLAGINGKSALSGAGLPGEPARQQQIGQALATILHRLRGPMNLLLGSDRPVGPGGEKLIDGTSVTRLVVGGGAFDVKAYYFNKSDRRLGFLTTGGDAPGRHGDVTVYEYQTLRDGLVFPSQIRVVRIGPNMLLGRESSDLLLEATFSDVRR